MKYLVYPFQLIFTLISGTLCALSIGLFPILFLPWAVVQLVGKCSKKEGVQKWVDAASNKIMTFLSQLQSTLLVIFWCPRLTIKGKENIPAPNEKACFIANHQGLIDPILFEMCIPQKLAYICKIELMKVPYVHLWMKTMHCVALDRRNPREGVKSILQGVEYIKQGHQQLIFPEGTRSFGKGMREFKGGSFKLATKANALIIPVTLDGTYKVFEQKPFAIRPFQKITVTIHPAIPTAGISHEEEVALHQKVWDIINNGLEKPYTEYLAPKKL